MIEVLRAAKEVNDFLQSRGWAFAFIGGLAVNRWGRARTTNDADVCVFSDFGNETAFIDPLIERFQARSPDAREFALANRVLLLTAGAGFGIDVSLGAFDFERRAIARSSPYDFPGGATLQTVSAEDLVVLKAFAGRPQDWFDVEGILSRQVRDIDMLLVEEELAPLCELKGAPEAMEQLRRIWWDARED